MQYKQDFSRTTPGESFSQSQIQAQESFDKGYKDDLPSFEKQQYILQHIENTRSRNWPSIINRISNDSSDNAFLCLQCACEEMRDQNEGSYKLMYSDSSNFINTLMGTCTAYDNIAYLLEEQHKYGSTKESINLIRQVQIFEDILQQMSMDRIEEAFLIEPFSNFITNKMEGSDQIGIEAIKQQKLGNWNQMKEKYLFRIHMIIQNFINKIANKAKNSQKLVTVYVRYLCILESKNKNDMEIIKQIKKAIEYSIFRKDGQILPEANTLLNYTFQVLKVQYDELDPIIIQENLHNVFDLFIEENLQQIWLTNHTEIMFDLYNIDDLIVIFKNMTQFTYTPNSVLAIQMICAKFREEKRLDILIQVYRQFIKPCVFKQIRCLNTLDKNVNLIQFFLHGFSAIQEEALNDQEIQDLLKVQTILKILKPRIHQQQFQQVVNLLQSVILTCPNMNTQLKQKISQLITEVKNPQQNLRISDLSQNQISNDMFTNKASDIVEIQDQEVITPEKYKGMHNPGNNCYLNSFIQCLFMTKRFRKFVLQKQIKMDLKSLLDINRDPFKQLIRLFYNLAYNYEAIQTDYLKQTVPIFSNTEGQQDAGEFGRLYLDFLDSEMKKISNSSYQSEIEKMFFGSIQNKIKCNSCKQETQNKENFMDLVLNFDIEAYDSKNNVFDLETMVKNYFTSIQFTDDNQYFCDKCSKYVNAQKNQFVDKFPPILILTLNRFTFDQKTQQGLKNTGKVILPFSINIKSIFKEFNIKEKIDDYHLYAFIVHLGGGPNSGHYISYCRDLDAQEQEQHNLWLCFDDTQVYQYPANDYFELDKGWSEQETPYMLFYTNRTKSAVDLQRYASQQSLIKSKK